MLPLAFFAMFAVFTFLGVLAVQVFTVHQIAKRMRPGTHKIWPIGIVFLYVPLLAASAVFSSNETNASSVQVLAFINLVPAIVPIAVIWWRFDYWDLSSETPVFGREAAERRARSNRQKPVQ
nr:hypothetical protein [Hyphomonas sp. Mor2]